MPDNPILHLIDRDRALFDVDLAEHGMALGEEIAKSRFLVIGGAGSIGGAVVRALFERSPKCLHVVDVNENGLAELVRDVRSSLGYVTEDFHAYAIDCLGPEFPAMVAASEGYDYVLNFSALKHVRSEKDPYTLMRMVDVNVYGTLATVEAALKAGAKKFFCVSTDKAANPVNMMGASKRIMELFLARESDRINVSTARFANVAFSNGSLPFSWSQRITKRQPIVAPRDVRRYFVTESESAILCLFSVIMGNNGDVLFPKLSEKLNLITFSSMALRYLESLGYEPVECDSEQEARDRVGELSAQKKWPVYFFGSDTTGEKDFEEFYTDQETVDWSRFNELGVVNAIRGSGADPAKLDAFTKTIHGLREAGAWSKTEVLDAFKALLGENFDHKEAGKHLDQKM
jgi:FlaA1/EpsC-like NDP-sugar epimerase